MNNFNGYIEPTENNRINETVIQQIDKSEIKINSNIQNSDIGICWFVDKIQIENTSENEPKNKHFIQEINYLKYYQNFFKFTWLDQIL